MDKTVIELFAGIGGFRVGLNHIEKIDRNGLLIINKTGLVKTALNFPKSSFCKRNWN